MQFHPWEVTRIIRFLETKNKGGFQGLGRVGRGSHARETVKGGKGARPCEDPSLKKSTMDGGREERTWGKGIRQRKDFFFSLQAQWKMLTRKGRD